MAFLNGKDHLPYISFDLQLLKSPDDGSDSFLYQATITDKDNHIIFKNKYEIEFDNGHEDLWYISQLYEYSNSLRDIKIEIPGFAYTGKCDDVAFTANTSWMLVTMTCTGNKRIKYIRSDIALHIEDDTYRLFRIFSDPDLAIKFGKELKTEMSKAAPNWWKENHVHA